MGLGGCLLNSLGHLRESESRSALSPPFEFELKKGRGIRLLTAIRFVPRLPVSNFTLLAAVACYLTATAGFEAWRVDAAMSARA